MVPAKKILEQARAIGADIVGLSGLITPSLDEMCHVAAELEREGFALPLLIGGATTSLAHTAVKISPNYHGPTVYVTDASRSVPVVSNLLSATGRDAFVQKTADDYAEIRRRHEKRSARIDLAPIAEARENRWSWDWSDYEPPRPARTGVEELHEYDLEELSGYIDWSPFFKTWELPGKYPAIFDDETVGTEARRLFEDARKLLSRIIDQRLLRAEAVFGLFPANAIGDDVELYRDENRKGIRAVIHFLRQQTRKSAGRPNRCLADFIAPRSSGRVDHFGLFVVTAGIGIDELVKEFESSQDDYNAILAKALADRLAEAFAERLHEYVRRKVWGYATEEPLDNAALIQEKYAGIRPAPGYPACPDHTEKETLFQLLDVTARTGIRLTESFAMWPAASVCGFYFSHPESHYFGVGKIGYDQLEDYARRKGRDQREMERWLAPVLA